MPTAHRITFLAALACLGLSPARAGATPDHRTVVYRGHLDVDGVPVNGPVDLTFEFYNQATGGSPLATVTKSKVPVANGEFAVELELPEAVLAADPIFIQVEASGVRFASRQRLRPAPLAVRGRGDGAFVADGNAEVRGDVLKLGTAAQPGTKREQKALVHAAGDVLTVNAGGDFEGGVKVESSLAVNGDLSVTGAVKHGDLSTWKLVVFEDFEGSQTGWSGGFNERSTCGDTDNDIFGGAGILHGARSDDRHKWLGKGFPVPTPHTEVMVRLVFYAIDTWDGEPAYVHISEAGSGRSTYSCVFAKPHYSDPTLNICGNAASDRVYAVECRAPHQGNNVSVWVGAALDDADESWGMDNLEIWVR